MKSIRILLGILALAACAVAGAADKGTIRIGAKVFTEQAILAQLTAQYLRGHGYDARITGNLGSTIAWNAVRTAQLDLMWEYTGTSLVAYNHVSEKLDRQASYQRVKQLDGEKGLVWLTPSRFSTTYALALPEQVVAEYPQIDSISDLAKALEASSDGNHLLALDIEFANRSDGLAGLAQTYGLHLSRDEVRQMDPGLVYTALRNGQVFAGLVYTTDGRLEAFKLKLLEDDRRYFPDYTAAPVANRAYLDAHPELEALLAPLAQGLDDDTMRRLNARVDVGHEPASAVAADYLKRQGLLAGGH